MGNTPPVGARSPRRAQQPVPSRLPAEPPHRSVAERELGSHASASGRRALVSGWWGRPSQGRFSALSPEDARLATQVAYLHGLSADAETDLPEDVGNELDTLMQRFARPPGRHSDEHTAVQVRAAAFCRLGGLEVLFELLRSLVARRLRLAQALSAVSGARGLGVGTPWEDGEMGALEAQLKLCSTVGNLALSLLRELLGAVHSLSGHQPSLGGYTPLAAILGLLQFPGDAQTASYCAEELVARCRFVPDLRVLQECGIDPLDSSLRLPVRALAAFCRVMVLMVYDADLHDPRSPPAAPDLVRRARRAAKWEGERVELLLGSGSDSSGAAATAAGGPGLRFADEGEDAVARRRGLRRHHLLGGWYSGAYSSPAQAAAALAAAAAAAAPAPARPRPSNFFALESLVPAPQEDGDVIFSSGGPSLPSGYAITEPNIELILGACDGLLVHRMLVVAAAGLLRPTGPFKKAFRLVGLLSHGDGPQNIMFDGAFPFPLPPAAGAAAGGAPGGADAAGAPGGGTAVAAAAAVAAQALQAAVEALGVGAGQTALLQALTGAVMDPGGALGTLLGPGGPLGGGAAVGGRGAEAAGQDDEDEDGEEEEEEDYDDDDHDEEEEEDWNHGHGHHGHSHGHTHSHAHSHSHSHSHGHSHGGHGDEEDSNGGHGDGCGCGIGIGGGSSAHVRRAARLAAPPHQRAAAVALDAIVREAHSLDSSSSGSGSDTSESSGSGSEGRNHGGGGGLPHGHGWPRTHDDAEENEEDMFDGELRLSLPQIVDLTSARAFILEEFNAHEAGANAAVFNRLQEVGAGAGSPAPRAEVPMRPLPGSVRPRRPNGPTVLFSPTDPSLALPPVHQRAHATAPAPPPTATADADAVGGGSEAGTDPTPRQGAVGDGRNSSGEAASVAFDDPSPGAVFSRAEAALSAVPPHRRVTEPAALTAPLFLNTKGSPGAVGSSGSGGVAAAAAASLEEGEAGDINGAIPGLGASRPTPQTTTPQAPPPPPLVTVAVTFAPSPLALRMTPSITAEWETVERLCRANGQALPLVLLRLAPPPTAAPAPAAQPPASAPESELPPRGAVGTPSTLGSGTPSTLGSVASRLANFTRAAVSSLQQTTGLGGTSDSSPAAAAADVGNEQGTQFPLLPVQPTPPAVGPSPPGAGPPPPPTPGRLRAPTPGHPPPLVTALAPRAQWSHFAIVPNSVYDGPGTGDQALPPVVTMPKVPTHRTAAAAAEVSADGGGEEEEAWADAPGFPLLVPLLPRRTLRHSTLMAVVAPPSPAAPALPTGPAPPTAPASVGTTATAAAGGPGPQAALGSRPSSGGSKTSSRAPPVPNPRRKRRGVGFRGRRAAAAAASLEKAEEEEEEGSDDDEEEGGQGGRSAGSGSSGAAAPPPQAPQVPAPAPQAPVPFPSSSSSRFSPSASPFMPRGAGAGAPSTPSASAQQPASAPSPGTAAGAATATTTAAAASSLTSTGPQATAAPVAGPPAPPAPRAPHAPASGARDIADAMLLSDLQPHCVDALFVLGSLMLGHRRRAVQDFLVAQGSLPLLLRGLTGVDWTTAGLGPGHYPRLHGPNCRCQPDTEGPLQMLRFVHSLGDRDASAPGMRWVSRRRFMTHEELERAFRTYGVAAPQLRPQQPPGGSTRAPLGSKKGAAAAAGKKGGGGTVTPPLLPNPTPVLTEGGALGINEAALLLESIPSSLCRPWGWGTAGRADPSAGGFVRGAALTLQQLLHQSSSGAATLPPDPAPLTLTVADPVLRGLNAAWQAPFDPQEIDIDDEEGEEEGAAMGRVASAAPKPPPTLPPILRTISLDDAAEELCSGAVPAGAGTSHGSSPPHRAPRDPNLSAKPRLRGLLRAARKAATWIAPFMGGALAPPPRSGAPSRPARGGRTFLSASAAAAAEEAAATKALLRRYATVPPELRANPGRYYSHPPTGSPGHRDSAHALAPRGLVSLLCLALQSSPRASPYRAWLISFLDVFLRGAPLPARRWLSEGHGLLGSILGELLVRHVKPALRRAAGGDGGGVSSDEDDEEEVTTEEEEEDDEEGLSGSSGSEGSGSSGSGSGASAAARHAAEEASYELQGLLDTLAEMVKRDPGAVGDMEALQGAWERGLEAGLQGTASDAPLPATAPSSPKVPVLLRFACDHLLDSNVMLRCLMLTEDWAYGIGGAAEPLVLHQRVQEEGGGSAAAAAAPSGAGPIAAAASTASASSGGGPAPVGATERITTAPWSWETLRSSTVRGLCPQGPVRAAIPGGGGGGGSGDAAEGAGASTAPLPAASAPNPGAPPPTLYPSSLTHTPALSSASLTLIREFRIPLIHAFLRTLPGTLAELNRENMCLLNSALLSFVIAHRHGALPALVGAVKEYEAAWGAQGGSGGAPQAQLVLLPSLLLPPTPTPEVPTATAGGVSGGLNLRPRGEPTAPTTQQPRTGPSGAGAPQASSQGEAAPTPGASPPLLPAPASGSPIARLLQLLPWWVEYYSLRESDRMSLCSISHYTYWEWRAVVRGLMGLHPVGPQHHPQTAGELDRAAASGPDVRGWIPSQAELLKDWVHACGRSGDCTGGGGGGFHLGGYCARYWATCCLL